MNFYCILCESSCFIETHDFKIASLDSFLRFYAQNSIGFKSYYSEAVGDVEENRKARWK
jgi:hypothetical protein